MLSYARGVGMSRSRVIARSSEMVRSVLIRSKVCRFSMDREIYVLGNIEVV